MLNINDLRKEYRLRSLDKKDLNPDPLYQFSEWFNDAREAGVLEPNAMTLATCTVEGKPSSRTVLLKEIDDQGLIFFTSYESRKARELEQNPFASVTFYWKELERQVVMDGNVERVSKEKSEDYFHRRPRGSQLSVWASHQDQIIFGKDVLESVYHEMEGKYENKEIPLPSYWGGYRIIPDRIEFWQGRENRLHDRFCYMRKRQNWEIYQLSP